MTKAILASLALATGIAVGASGVCTHADLEPVPYRPAAASTAPGPSAASTLVLSESQ